MGVNICIYKCDVERIDAEDWDYIRQGWDREFRFVTECEYLDQDGEGFILVRPKDIKAERAQLERVPPDYRKRYEHMLDLLERHSNFYVHWSY